MILIGKKILLAVSGSIAAYKAALIVRLLVKEGADVKVLMTPISKEFITPLTLSTLSKKPVSIDFFSKESGDWDSHVDLGLWADAMLIAPATANTLGKMANAIADNLVITTYLSAKCQVFFAPAMDLDMYQHPANQKNIKTLQSFGNILIEPSSGELASGLTGKGRMEEPEIIVDKVIKYFQSKNDFIGKKVMITAGPTHENIDPVRFIGNYSSGKMGFALAEELAQRGAEVTLISGPVSIQAKHTAIQRINVVSATQMLDACVAQFQKMDIAIMAAAVADYTPEEAFEQKMKRKGDSINISLKPTQDIAAELGKIKKTHQLLIGFALETNDELANAQKKLVKKNLDFIVLNSLKEEGAGFQKDTNKISIIEPSGEIQVFELKSKQEVAKDIINKVKMIIKS